MKITAPSTAPMVTLNDINGNSVTIGAPGNQTLLCFFRDPACPFCNFRVFELTHRFQELSALGLDIITVFAAPQDEEKRFVAARPRPFPVIADVGSIAYAAYGVERSSLWGGARQGNGYAYAHTG
jgi:thioredoxin-dependent peroxiredoxin